MQIAVLKIVALVALFFVTTVFAILPIKLKSVRKGILRSITCFCGGLFLGVCFLHLVPDVIREVKEVFPDGNSLHFPYAEFTIVVGLLLVLTVEKIVSVCQPRSKTCKDSEDCCKDGCKYEEDKAQKIASEVSPLLKGDKIDVVVKYDVDAHMCKTETVLEEAPEIESLELSKEKKFDGCCTGRLKGRAEQNKETIGKSVPKKERIKNPDLIVAKLRALCMVLALSIHSFLEGLVIGLQDNVHNITELLVLIGFHKSLVAFSLGVTLLKSGASTLGHIREAVIFALASPLGTFVGLLLTNYNIESVHMTVLASLTGLATGTFIYVTFFEILGQGLKGETKADLLNAFFCILGFAIFCGLVLIPGGGH